MEDLLQVESALAVVVAQPPAKKELARVPVMADTKRPVELSFPQRQLPQDHTALVD